MQFKNTHLIALYITYNILNVTFVPAQRKSAAPYTSFSITVSESSSALPLLSLNSLFVQTFMYDLCSKVLFLWWYRPPYLLSSHKYPKPYLKLHRTFLTRDTEMMSCWRENSILPTFLSSSMQHQEVIDPDLFEKANIWHWITEFPESQFSSPDSESETIGWIFSRPIPRPRPDRH